jgi:hypothetical protein
MFDAMSFCQAIINSVFGPAGLDPISERVWTKNGLRSEGLKNAKLFYISSCLACSVCFKFDCMSSTPDMGCCNLDNE